MKKNYCYNCSHNWGYYQQCVAPFTGGITNYFQIKKLCEDINKNNDCKHFEEIAYDEKKMKKEITNLFHFFKKRGK